MAGVSELIERHASILERPEFRWEPSEARIRFEVEDGAWLAEAGRRMVLRPARREDRPADLTLVMKGEDLARHLRGELDLFCSIEPRLRLRFAPDAESPELISLARRILGALNVSCQGGDRFRGTIVEQLYLADRSVRADGGFEPMGTWSLPFNAGMALYELVTSRRLERTLEVGMAHGLSTLFIGQAHEDNGRGHHVAIDPWQSEGFGRAGVLNVERAGLGRFVELLEEPNYSALPRLLATSPGRFQLAFVDGLHIFDHVLLDFFYCDRLLAQGGFLVFDDSNLPAVRSVLEFLRENRPDSYERVSELCTDRINVFVKRAEDARIEEHGVIYHRPFPTTGPEFTPLPPPRSPRILKRAFDLVLALLAGLVLLPVGLVIALAILLEDLVSGEPLTTPFRKQPRFSGETRFDLRRFRTFRPSQGPGVTSRVGGVIERLHLSGLPLLLGILAGRLSFVGPMPVKPDDEVRRQRFRECGMRPGLVGLQDLKGRVAGSGAEYYQDFVQRGQLSLLAYDVSIMARTLFRVARSVLRS